jgi:hypothetical protein
MSAPADKSQETPKLRFPKEYAADSPETKERRRKLFAAINAGHSKASEEAANRIHEEFFGKYE